MHTKYKGYIGELIACVILLLKGYNILHTRYKTNCGEIDIIASKKDLIIFVEVKQRKTLERCFEAIYSKQLERIMRASDVFLIRNQQLNNYQRRYDLVLVSLSSFPRHIQNVTM